VEVSHVTNLVMGKKRGGGSVYIPLTMRRMRQSRKMMSRAMALSLWAAVMPSTNTRSRPNDVRTITASNIYKTQQQT